MTKIDVCTVLHEGITQLVEHLETFSVLCSNIQQVTRLSLKASIQPLSMCIKSLISQFNHQLPSMAATST